MDYAQLDTLKLWYNNLPKGEAVQCYLSPIKALPHLKAKLVNPSIRIGGHQITFPTTLESGNYLEFRSLTDCKVYDAKGELVAEIKPQGDIPQLEAGSNLVGFSCNVAEGLNARANVTIINQGDQLVSNAEPQLQQLDGHHSTVPNGAKVSPEPATKSETYNHRYW